MVTANRQLRVPPHLRRTAQRGDGWLRSAGELVDLLCRTFGVDDLGDQRILDVGCGTKLTKYFFDGHAPVGHYTGIDAYGEVVDFLRSNVSDPRFSYHHIDVHNEAYNPGGQPLADLPALPVGDETFDIICLFSVFTHLAPHDYQPMLRLLRPCVRPDGGLLYSLFVHGRNRTRLQQGRHSPGPEKIRGWVVDAAAEPSRWAEVRDAVREAASSSPAAVAVFDDLDARCLDEGLAPDVAGPLVDRIIDLVAEPPADQGADLPDEPGEGSTDPYGGRFKDVYPDRPLMRASYTESFALELVEDTGWEVVSLNPPEPSYIQHYIVCRPR
jgi:SAM-dependent methyltransferase